MNLWKADMFQYDNIVIFGIAEMVCVCDDDDDVGSMPIHTHPLT